MRDWLWLNRPALPAYVLVVGRLVILPLLLLFVGLSWFEWIPSRALFAALFAWILISCARELVFLIEPKLVGAAESIAGEEHANLNVFDEAEKHYRRAFGIICTPTKKTTVEYAAIAAWIITLVAGIVLLPLYCLSWVEFDLLLGVLGWSVLLMASWQIYHARRSTFSGLRFTESDELKTTETDNSRDKIQKDAVEPTAGDLGMWDTFYADLLSRLAFVTRMQGNFDDAEQFAKRAVALHETSWGEAHPRTLASREFLARLYLEIARYKEADALLLVALQRRHSTGTGNSLEASQCLNDLGRSAVERGECKRAEAFFLLAYDLVQTLNVGDTPLGVTVTHNFVFCLTELGQYDHADGLIKSLLQRTDRQGSPDSLLVASSLYHLALIRLLRNEPDAAEPIARRALATLMVVAPQDGSRIATFNGLIGRILMKQKKFAEAEPLLKELLKWREEYLAPEHPLLAESLEFYGELLRSQSGFLEAADYYHRAQQIRDFHK